MSAEKQLLRADLLSRHDTITDAALQQASEIIQKTVLQELLKLKHANGTAHVYRASSGWKEIATQQLVHDMQVTLGYSIDQPDIAPQASMSDRKYDVVIMPCLGFDAACNRLGRGRGWYDEFVASQPQALKIGLACDVLRCNTIPLESHDQQLDMVVTERAVYTSHGK